VKPKSRIVSNKPAPPPPAAEQWIKDGGIDPEVQKEPVADPEPPESPQPEMGKPYPHRISFDTDKQQYKRLKRASFEEERSLNDILREAAEEWLKANDY
jgi:hypothetical protein